MMTEDDVRRIIQEEDLKNYRGGVPAIAPHQHDGVDNLQIQGSNILNLPKATPGGDPTDVQFNDNGTFGGDSTFVFDKATSTLAVPTIQGSIDPNNTSDLTLQSDFVSNVFLQTIDTITAGSTGDISINTGDDDSTGKITVTTGTSTTTGTSGVIELTTGDTDTGNSGHINLTTGTVNTSGNSGGMTLLTGDASGVSGDAGDINITAGFGPENGGNINLNSGSGGSVPGSITMTSQEDITMTANQSVGSIAEDFIFLRTQASGKNTGNIEVSTGDATNTHNTGNILIQAGNVHDFSETVGNITIQTPVDKSVQGGVIQISRGEGNANVSSRLLLNDDGGGTPQATVSAKGIVYILSNTSIHLGQVDNTNANGGTVFIQNRTGDPSTPTGGGILYTKSGALYYIGSSGTVTPLAPA